MKSDVLFFLDNYEKVVEYPSNLENKKYWDTSVHWPRDMWRGFPLKKPREGIPFLIFPDNALWSQILQVDLRDFYSDPITHLEKQLKMSLFHFENWKDNTWFNRDLFIWFGVVTELSFFGPPIRFFAEREPWIEGEPVLQDKRKLASMKFPNFYDSGLMPRIHQFYREMKYIVKDRFQVLFPSWVRGPFCIACHLRGLENIILDIYEDPQFVHELMDFIVASEKEWVLERAKFLELPIDRGMLFNDEVGLPLITPQMYEEFVLPYELELAEFYGGIIYWHSCGDTTPFMDLIKSIPGLRMFHVGPRTDIERAFQIFDSSISLDVDLDPFRDVIEASREEMEKKLERILKLGLMKNHPFCIRADGFQLVNTLAEDLSKIKLWMEVADSIIHKEKLDTRNIGEDN